ncbi:unnamed protein product [Rhizophagus irregularis]|nr:unnamed protein product [Rhizophagus irregularis]
MQNMTADDEDILTFNCIFLPTRYYQSDISELARHSKNERLTNLKLVANISKDPDDGYYIAEQYDVIVLKANKKDAVDVLRHQVTKRLKPLFNISSSTLRLFMLKYDTSIYEVINTYNSMVPDATEVKDNSNENKNDSDESVSTDSKTSQGSMTPDTTEVEGNPNKSNLNDSVNSDNKTIQEVIDKFDKLHKLPNANRNVRNRVNRVNPDNQANPLKSREMKPYEKIGYYFDKNGRTNDIQIIASDDKYDPYNTGKKFLEVQEY